MMKIFLLTVLTTAALLVQSEDVVPSGDRCTNVACMMECGDNGFKVDQFGCQVCACQEKACADLEKCPIGTVCKTFPISRDGGKIVAKCIDPTLPARCHPPVDQGTCRAYVPSWYYDSESGACQEFVYGGCQGNENRFQNKTECQTGCTRGASKCKEITCMMFCEGGFEKDSEGCSICRCTSPSASKSAPAAAVDARSEGCPTGTPACMKECPNGFKKDPATNCDLCECVDAEMPPQCPEPTPDCLMECQFGMKKGMDGCTTCECLTDPCVNYSCPMRKVCEAVKDAKGNMVPMCRAFSVCKSVMCAMHCENGFIVDKFGCDVCRCHEMKPAECPLAKCSPCPFGFEFTEDGCRTCSCLENPCKTKKCDGANEICVIKQEENFCPTCPAQGLCVGHALVKYVELSMKYTSLAKDIELDIEKFRSVVLERMLNDLLVHEHCIRKFEVMTQAESGDVLVTFQVICAETVPLVERVKGLLQKVESGAREAVINHEGVDYVPDFSATQASYYASTAHLDDNAGDEEPAEAGLSTTQMIIVAVCSVAGAVLAIALIAGTCRLIKRRRNQTETKSTKEGNYHRAASR